MTQPVLWQVDVENMILDGASGFVEVGPGKSLAGFGKRINPTVRFVQFCSPHDLDAVIDLYEEASVL
jgi:[acyl-carrier-protein] S-malonyltransferase